MGANAQTSVPAFTAGQVLTAAQVTGINTGIPVFASSTERDAAFGGTGEKTLAEGQMAYLEDTNATQYYDGSSWVALGKQPGLTLIKKVTMSAVASASEDNVFTSDYDNYLILTNIVTSVDSDIRLRVRASSTDDTGNNYLHQLDYTTTGTYGGSSPTFTGFILHPTGTTSSVGRAELFGPALADRTGMISMGIRNNSRLGKIGAYHNLTTAYDGFTIYPDSGTISGTLWLYGYDKD